MADYLHVEGDFRERYPSLRPRPRAPQGEEVSIFFKKKRLTLTLPEWIGSFDKLYHR